jgi:DNA-binding CsgD family transcriptional regulator
MTETSRASAKVNDLSHLNDGECQVLALLAEGHTVKSIANVTGWTVAAVNERLRAARRKTGVGSSRELARLFAHQRRPNKIGLEASSKTALNVIPKSGDSARSKWKGATIMMLVLLTALGAALALQPQSTNRSDPMLGNLLDQPDPKWVLQQMRSRQNPDKVLAPEGLNAILRQLHSQVRTEKRDENWSPRMEAILRRFFLQVPSVASSPNQLRVLCSATLCEVTASLPSRHAAEGQLYLPEFQDPGQDAAVEKLGLRALPKVLGSANGRPLYLSYWGRDSSGGQH